MLNSCIIFQIFNILGLLLSSIGAKCIWSINLFIWSVGQKCKKKKTLVACVDAVRAKVTYNKYNQRVFNVSVLKCEWPDMDKITYGRYKVIS